MLNLKTPDGLLIFQLVTVQIHQTQNGKATLTLIVEMCAVRPCCGNSYYHNTTAFHNMTQHSQQASLSRKWPWRKCTGLFFLKVFTRCQCWVQNLDGCKQREKRQLPEAVSCLHLRGSPLRCWKLPPPDVSHHLEQTNGQFLNIFSWLLKTVRSSIGWVV